MCAPLMYRPFAALGLVLLMSTAPKLLAVEIRGQVSDAADGRVTVTTDSPVLPRVGDKAEILIELKAIKSTALVTAGTVTAVDATAIVIKVDNPKASINKGQLAKITSENPIPREEAGPGNPPPPQPPPPDPAGPADGQRGVTTITFDHLKTAPGLPPDALAAQGITLILGPRCDARIEDAIPAMVMPEGRAKLLMVTQDQAESRYAMAFARPVRKVTITRPGVIDGATMPKWKLAALNKAGKVLASCGEEEFGADPEIRAFSVEADGIAKVTIAVDNHWNNTTYATFSCLPIAEMEVVSQDAKAPPEKDSLPFDDVPGN